MTSKDENPVHQQSITEASVGLGAKGTEGESEQLPADSANVRETVDEALAAVDGGSEQIQFAEALAAEVRRLRDGTVLAELRAEAGVLQGRVLNLAEERDRLRAEADKRIHDTSLIVLENERLREERDELVKWGDGWKQQWEEMRDTMWKPAMAKLERVEALLPRWRFGTDSNGKAHAAQLEAALRDEVNAASNPTG